MENDRRLEILGILVIALSVFILVSLLGYNSSEEPSISPNIQKNIEISISPNNKNGEKLKVILGSKTAAEGLDFKRIRNVYERKTCQ